MNRILFFVLGFFLLINFACKKEHKQNKEIPKKTSKKYSFVIKRNVALLNLNTKQVGDTKKMKDFFKLLESFYPQSFSLDELIELVDKDLKIVKRLEFGRQKEPMDTAAIKSRIVLMEVYLNKLNYLIHKQKLKKDTITSTLDAIVVNLNSLIHQINIYSNSTDEFESILKHDSIMKNKQKIQGRDKQVFSKFSVKRKSNILKNKVFLKHK